MQFFQYETWRIWHRTTVIEIWFMSKIEEKPSRLKCQYFMNQQTIKPQFRIQTFFLLHFADCFFFHFLFDLMTGFQYSHKWMFSLLFAIQTNSLFAWATKTMFAGPCAAAISIEKIPTTNSKSIGATTYASRAIHSTSWTGSSFFKMRTFADIFIECATRIGSHSIPRSHIRCVLNEWLSNPSELLYNRLYEQSAGKISTKHRFGATICWILYIVFDAHRSEWGNHIGSTSYGLRSTVSHKDISGRLPNSHKKKVSWMIRNGVVAFTGCRAICQSIRCVNQIISMKNWCYFLHLFTATGIVYTIKHYLTIASRSIYSIF